MASASSNSTRSEPFRLPDPFSANLRPASPREQSRELPESGRQRALRSLVLAVTRQMLATSTHKQLTVRQIAEACGTTAQTIHNNFGSRHELLASAINEHTTVFDCSAYSISPAPVMFLNLGKLYYQCAVDTPEFLREMVTAAFSDKWKLMSLLQPHSTRHKATFIRQMGEQQLLRDFVDPERLASQITRINTISIFDWSQHGDTEELYRQITDGVMLLLLGALKKEYVPEVEAWLSAEHARLAN